MCMYVYYRYYIRCYVVMYVHLNLYCVHSTKYILMHVAMYMVLYDIRRPTILEK